VLNADATTMSWKAPGDDVLCGTADHYEVVQSNSAVTGANFADATPVPGAPAPVAPGVSQSMDLPAAHDKFVAIRAVDEQGNVGPPASVEVPSYARPKGATPLQVSLVPAYNECASPNRQHGAPLSFGSCAPPHQASSQLTVGTPDANGQPANSVGSVLFGVIAGDPNTSENEADVRIAAQVTDVRNRGTLSDYAGELSVQTVLQITDRMNGPGQNEPGTVVPFQSSYTVPCAATTSTTTGGRCALSSTFNALVPGSVVEGKRAIWELGAVDVFDGGPDGQATTASGNTLFERQGVFVP
jgi:hypothetical protein